MILKNVFQNSQGALWTSYMGIFLIADYKIKSTISENTIKKITAQTSYGQINGLGQDYSDLPYGIVNTIRNTNVPLLPSPLYFFDNAEISVYKNHELLYSRNPLTITDDISFLLNEELMVRVSNIITAPDILDTEDTLDSLINDILSNSIQITSLVSLTFECEKNIVVNPNLNLMTIGRNA